MIYLIVIVEEERKWAKESNRIGANTVRMRPVYPHTVLNPKKIFCALRSREKYHAIKKFPFNAPKKNTCMRKGAFFHM